jgi:hypothetical protein
MDKLVDNPNYEPSSDLGKKIKNFINPNKGPEQHMKMNSLVYNEMEDINYLLKRDTRLEQLIEKAKLDTNMIENSQLKKYQEESCYIKNKIKKIQQKDTKI